MDEWWPTHVKGKRDETEDGFDGSIIVVVWISVYYFYYLF